MAANPWLAWLLPIAFSGPWIAAIIWICLKSELAPGDAAPSLAEQARRRLSSL
ncbi:MAG: hypothetical protein WBB76_12710 [Gaiellaceae bacterium]